MRLIIIDGPERAGKTTIVNELLKLGAVGVHWGPITDDAVYGETLARQFTTYGATNRVVVWDRSWASESVYSRLLGRGRRLGDDPWLGEWLYGRAAMGCGMRVILLGPSVEVITTHRDSSDLPVDPTEERKAFRDYGTRFGWRVIENRHDAGYAKLAAAWMFGQARSLPQRPLPPAYCGPVDPDVLVVGESRSNHPGLSGAWLPFTSRFTTKFGSALGDPALRCGWSNQEDDPRTLAEGAKLVIACGKVAQDWAHGVLGNDGDKVLDVPHPSWMYRWAAGNEAIGGIERSTRMLVQQHLKGQELGQGGN